MVPTITWISRGTFLDQNPRGALHSSKPVVASANRRPALRGSPLALLLVLMILNGNIFLTADPESDLSHITGHSHQRDDTGNLNVGHEKRGNVWLLPHVRSFGLDFFFI